MHSRKDTDGVYSQIVYQKGAAILVMLDGWLGEDRVREGLRSYLSAHKFGNATTADLESALGGSKPVLDTFLNQTGIPSIRAKCEYTHLVLEQINASRNWNVPVCWRGDGVDSSCTVISGRAETKVKSCPAWIYLNSGGSGYYRTEWSPEQLAALDPSKLTAPERLTLIYDLRAQKNFTSPLLKTLATDIEPEIAKAATDALAGK
jgi:aminopeptidase N